MRTNHFWQIITSSELFFPFIPVLVTTKFWLHQIEYKLCMIATYMIMNIMLLVTETHFYFKGDNGNITVGISQMLFLKIWNWHIPRSDVIPVTAATTKSHKNWMLPEINARLLLERDLSLPEWAVLLFSVAFKNFWRLIALQKSFPLPQVKLLKWVHDFCCISYNGVSVTEVVWRQKNYCSMIDRE